MVALLCFFLTLFASPFKSKSRLEAENSALRHQLIVLQRRVIGVRGANPSSATSRRITAWAATISPSRWRSHQRRTRRCRLPLQPAPALVRGAFTRPLVDPLPRPLGRPRFTSVGSEGIGLADGGLVDLRSFALGSFFPKLQLVQLCLRPGVALVDLDRPFEGVPGVL